MRQMRNMMLHTGLMVIVSFTISCTNSDLGLFELNEASSSYKLFNILDDYPSLKDGVESLDQDTFNTKMADSVNANIDDFIVMSDKLTGLISNNGAWDTNPLYDALQSFRVILERIKYQDSNDYESGFTSYSSDLTGFLDTASTKNLSLSTDLVTIIRTFMNYYKNTYTSEDLEIRMNDLITDLQDPLTKTDLENIFGIVSRLTVQADYPMYQLSSDGTLNTVSHSTSGTSLGLGNAVAGNVSLVKGLNEMIHRDTAAKNELYSIIREIGPAIETTNGVDASNNTNDSGHVLKDLISNLEDFCTIGGAVYSSDSRYNTNSSTTYSNTNIQNVFRDFFPGISALLMRDDRSPSYLAETAKKKYLIDHMSKALGKLNIDWDNAKIEESLYDLIRYDLYGRDRQTDSDAWGASFIETLLFLGLTGTSGGWEDGGSTGEAGFNPNDTHGHGANTGFVTLNDAFFSMRTNNTIEIGSSGQIGLYQLVFSNNCETYYGNIYRNNKTPFTGATASSSTFRYDQNVGAMDFICGPAVGDVGLPTGGANGGSLNSYVPYCGDGIRENNLTSWVLGWIARACWNGEGPYYYADTNASTLAIDGATYYAYKRPNGKVYAYINKSTSPWTYIYPVDESDPSDTASARYAGSSKYQRENRFHQSWYTDYYLIHWVDTFGTNRYYAPDGTYSTNSSTSAARLLYNEKSFTDTQRACASQEEAVFRNYQWLNTEKKFVLVIPLYAALLTERAGAYVMAEANGLAGVTALRKFRNIQNDGNWAKDTGTGDSQIPGDYRISVKLKTTGMGVISLTTINSTLGNGSLVPAALSHTGPSLYRLGFPRSPLITNTNYVQNCLGSQDFIASSTDVNWKQRNALLPIVAALVGVLNEHSDVSHHAIRKFLPLLYPPVYPLFHYNKAITGALQQSWLPRITGKDTSNYDFLYPDCELDGFVSSTSDPKGWYGGDTVRYYYQPRPITNVFSLLVDSSLNSDGTPQVDRSLSPMKNRVDGLLPLLTNYSSASDRSTTNQSPTRFITGIVKLITMFGDSSYDDSAVVKDNDPGTWGTRRRLLYGLEQDLTTCKLMKGTAVSEMETNVKKIVFPKWMFTDYGMRPEDINLDKTLDILIGDNTYANGGLSVFPDERNSGDSNYPSDANGGYRENWQNFYDNIAMLKSFTASTGDYTVIDNLINVVDKGIGGVAEGDITDDRADALVHTIGMIMSRYDTTDNKWLVDGESSGFSSIIDLITKELPVILSQFRGNYSGTLAIGGDMMAPDGFIEYIMKTATTSYTWSDIIDDGCAFLADPVVARDSVFWHDLVDLLNDMASTLKDKEKINMSEIYENSGFQYNGAGITDDMGNYNLYKGLGNALSK